ncbi:uncharacterized protein LOC116258334 [Nymphaea colorata]|nr:uncharacterized protein LOC116258334 [Nymphaea colorata]
MVCLACLLPLFLVPIVNILPLLFDFLMARVYKLFGWEYRKPERAPPACPYRPSSQATGGITNAHPAQLGTSEKPVNVSDAAAVNRDKSD